MTKMWRREILCHEKNQKKKAIHAKRGLDKKEKSIKN